MLQPMSSVAAVVASRLQLQRARPAGAFTLWERCYTRQRENVTPPEPGHTLEQIEMPPADAPLEYVPEEPNTYVRKPVTSAHAIDLTRNKLSMKDSAAISPNGSVVHGRYGDLGQDVAQSIPLEYLALLQPAAEGAAALRVITDSQEEIKKGTLLVYGASQPNAMATLQLASTAGHAVVAVVGGEHAGSDAMMSVIKGLASEPGTAVAQNYAKVNKNFSDLVNATIHGDTYDQSYNSDDFLAEFKTNLLEYAAKYPSTLPAAVDKSHLDFQYGDKEREYFRDNMDAYLSQFPAGSAPFDLAKVDAYFDTTQYAIFKAKFNKQTSAVITGDPVGDFTPTDVVQNMIRSPEPVDDKLKQNGVEGIDFVPYEFSVLNQKFGEGVEPKKGGPLLGAVIAVTPTLLEAATIVDQAKTLRGKAEALYFLTGAQRNTFAAAKSVVNFAKQHGAPVYTVGGTFC